jgi:hypothetical protein
MNAFSAKSLLVSTARKEKDNILRCEGPVQRCALCGDF